MLSPSNFFIGEVLRGSHTFSLQTPLTDLGTCFLLGHNAKLRDTAICSFEWLHELSRPTFSEQWLMGCEEITLV